MSFELEFSHLVIKTFFPDHFSWLTTDLLIIISILLNGVSKMVQKTWENHLSALGEKHSLSKPPYPIVM